MRAEQPAERDPVAEIAARLPVTDRPSWLILLGLALLVAAGVAWAVFGQTPEMVAGPGIVVPERGFVEVGVALRGTVDQVFASPGDTIAAGSAIARIESETGESIVVTAPVSGMIATVLIREGGITDRGTALVTMEPKSSKPVVVAFVPAGPGKRVEPGMAAQVSLAAAPRSQYGSIVGKVLSVSPVPVSPERITMVVGGNPSLADYFMTSGPILEVTTALEPDPATPSGYKWTTGEGPRIAVTPGSLTQVAVIVEEAAPVQRILK